MFEKQTDDEAIYNNNDTSSQKNRDEIIQNEIKMSDAHLRNCNDQEEKISNNLLKISIFLSTIVISLTILVFLYTKNIINIINPKCEEEQISFSFLHFSHKIESKGYSYSLYCINNSCNVSVSDQCEFKLKSIQENFKLECEDFLNIKIAGLIVIQT